MKKLKITILFSYFFILTFSSPIKAKIKMLKLDQMKGNINTAISEATRQTKESFTKMVESQKKDKNFKKKMDKLYQLADAITISSNSHIKGLDLHKHAMDKKIEAAQAFIETAKWGKENETVKTYQKEPEKGIQFLRDTILKEYAESKAPIIPFVIAIDKEQKELEEHVEQLIKHTQKRQTLKNDDDLTALESTIAKLLEIQKNLDTLIEMINKLINDED